MADFNTHGGYFAPKGWMEVNAGGSHEENPNGGVQIGVDEQGIPNMLEEGEPVYDDYVYSDNIKADARILKKMNLPEKYGGKLYSEIAEDFLKEAEERPLDPISNNGLQAMLGRLADSQEEQKARKEKRELKKEIESLSPEELAMLESALSGEEAVPVEQQPINPEIMQQPVMMKCGGLMHKYDGYSMPTQELMGVNKPNFTITPEYRAAMIKAGQVPQFDRNYNLGPATYNPVPLGRAYSSEVVAAPVAEQNQETIYNALPTFPRYAGAITAGILGLHNLAQTPDRYRYQKMIPTLIEGNLPIQLQRYQPIDFNIPLNAIQAQGNASTRAIANAGLGPSTGANLIANNAATTNALGTGFLQAYQANNQQRNNVIAANNAALAQQAQLEQRRNMSNAYALNQAQAQNIQNDITEQRLNYEAEGQKYAAIQNQLDQVGEALSNMGRENFMMNQINSDDAYRYFLTPNGTVLYKSAKCGGRIKTQKK